VLLWLGPLLLLVAGCVILARQLRSRRSAEPPQLTPEERSRAQRLLSGREQP
jgi:cytochrome c-type biogenesis protein CcmH/NrfF